jgi:hypothetical protein
MPLVIDTAQGDLPDWLRRTVIRLDPIPDWLLAVIEPVLTDLQRPHPVALRMAYGPSRRSRDAEGDDGPILWIWEADEVGATGCWVGGEDRWVDAEALVRFADLMQEQVFPETQAAWGEARPGCPGHSHPAAPTERDGEAWWICPLDRRPIAMIGHLGE